MSSHLLDFDTHAAAPDCRAHIPTKDGWDNFGVTVTKHEGDRLGINTIERRGYFEIESVKERGLIAEWNRANPTRAVRQGDELAEVNSVYDTLDHMRRTMKQGGALRFIFRRETKPGPKLSQWLPVQFEWAMCAIIWASTFIWVMCPEVEPHDACPKFDSWLPASVMWLAGYPLFLNFVSHIPSAYDIFDFLMNWVCLLFCVHYECMMPFLCGAFCGPVFLMPVLAAAKMKLVKYDTDSYSLGVGWTTGISNALMFLAETKGNWITQHQRFVIQVLGWTAVMSGIPIVMLLSGRKMTSMTLSQHIRYSAFKLSVYTFVYYGVCYNFEGEYGDQLTPPFDSTSV